MLLKLDFSNSVPIYQQIRDQIVQGIASGELEPGGANADGSCSLGRMRR